MKQKRFIKLMRAAHYPRHIIQQAVDAVKSCGGVLSYAEFLSDFKLWCVLTQGCPYSYMIRRIKETHSSAVKNLKVIHKQFHYGKKAQFTIIDEEHEINAERKTESEE